MLGGVLVGWWGWGGGDVAVAMELKHGGVVKRTLDAMVGAGWCEGSRMQSGHYSFHSTTFAVI